MTTSVTKENFTSEVLGNEKLVLVDFWAEWCGPCKQIGPALEEISEELDGKVKIVKVNDDRRALQLQYRNGATKVTANNFFAV